MSELSEQQIIKLCRAGRCCPTMTVQEDEVILTDDYEGKVRLTHDEMEILFEKYQGRPK